MKKLLLPASLVLVILAATFLGQRWYLSRQKVALAALQVTSIPSATVFLEEKALGKTPFYDEKLEPGEYTLKLVAEGEATASATWQGKIKLFPQLLTAVNHRLTPEEAFSSGEILTLEPLTNKEATELLVFSSPDGAIVKVDEVDKGVTPLIIKDVTVSDHRLLLSYPGYEEDSLRVRTNKGFKLIANVKLALLSAPEESSPSAAKISEALVLITQTPTGWLRVRIEPSLSASEVAKIEPEQTYPLLEEKPGWFKISYEEGKEGWISSQYAVKQP